MQFFTYSMEKNRRKNSYFINKNVEILTQGSGNTMCDVSSDKKCQA